MDVIVITGGSKGIGRAVVELFQRRGWRVVNLSRTPCPLPGVVHLEADLAAPGLEEAVRGPLEAAVGEGARVALIHNAATLRKDTVESASAASLRAVLEVGVVAPAILNRILLPRMGRGSAIVYVGSTLSEKAVGNAFSYVTCKHALIGMMRATCQDLMGRGIHTAAVCPGFTDTEMLRAHVGHDEGALGVAREMVGDNRLIEPREIAEVIAFAVESPVVNGAVLHANLGQRER